MTKILFLLSHPSTQDLIKNKPFSDAAGFEFMRMLDQAGICSSDYAVHYVLAKPPLGGVIDNALVKTKEMTSPSPYPTIKKGFSLNLRYTADIKNLYEVIRNVNPNVIVPLGAFSLWSLLEDVAKYHDFKSPITSAAISKLRGQIFNTPTQQIIPTLEPANILRDWASRPVGVFDLMKIKRHMDKRQFSPDVRRLCLEPTMKEVDEYLEKCYNADVLSFDIETKQRSITCIGFAADPKSAICIPFYDPRKPDNSYWSASDEKIILRKIKALLESPVRKLAQNGMYDVQYLTAYGIRIVNFTEDTMILHHSLYSEMQKGLAFLASIYTDELAWKFTRNNDDFKMEA